MVVVRLRTLNVQIMHLVTGPTGFKAGGKISSRLLLLLRAHARVAGVSWAGERSWLGHSPKINGLNCFVPQGQNTVMEPVSLFLCNIHMQSIS